MIIKVVENIVDMIKNKTAKNKMDIIDTSFWETWITFTNIAYLITLALTVIFVGINIFLSAKLSDAKDHNSEVNKSRTESTIADLKLQNQHALLGTEEIKKQNIELSLALEKEKTRRLQIEKEFKSKIQSTSDDLKETQEKMEDRTISDEQKKEFIEFFDNKTKLEVDLYVIPNDEEAFQFLNKINELLTTTGFKCEFKGFLLDPPSFNGVILYAPTNNFPPVVEMQKVLNSIGVRNIGHIKENQSFSHMKIVITKKP